VSVSDRELIERAYTAYNAQDLNGLLAVVSPDVDWPAGSDTSDRLHGTSWSQPTTARC